MSPAARPLFRHGGARRFQHFFSHLNRRGGAPSGAAAFIAMVINKPSLIVSDYHEFHGKSSFVYIRLFSAAAWRMTPSLSQSGKQPKGSIPLTPFFSGYISTLSGVFAIGGMPERWGRKHEKLDPPRAIVCFYEDFNRAKNCYLEVKN